MRPLELYYRVETRTDPARPGIESKIVVFIQGYNPSVEDIRRVSKKEFSGESLDNILVFPQKSVELRVLQP